MLKTKKKCLVCGKPSESEYCFNHKPRKPLLKSIKKEEGSSEKMRDFFLSIWKKRPHYSEVSGTYLGKEPLTIFFHHILSKEKYPQAEYDEDNIILLTFNEHSNVEMDMYKYDVINQKRKFLLIEYGKQ